MSCLVKDLICTSRTQGIDALKLFQSINDLVKGVSSFESIDNIDRWNCERNKGSLFTRVNYSDGECIFRSPTACLSWEPSIKSNVISQSRCVLPKLAFIIRIDCNELGIVWSFKEDKVIRECPDIVVSDSVLTRRVLNVQYVRDINEKRLVIESEGQLIVIACWWTWTWNVCNCTSNFYCYSIESFVFTTVIGLCDLKHPRASVSRDSRCYC